MFLIRLTSFDNVKYNSLRNEYLEMLVSENVVAFDDADVLSDDTKPHQGYTATTYDILNKSCKRLADYLFDQNGNAYRSRLRLLLVGPDEMPRSFGGTGNCPATMRSVFEHIISGGIWSNGLWTDGLLGGLWTIQSKDVRMAIEGIFCYANMNKDKGNDDNMAYRLVNRLKAETCPFCNRIYTKTLMKGSDGGGIRPELDHFYPKSKYPYLAVSLFNLIPICSYCNRQKSNHAEMYTRSRRYRHSIIYPYDEAFDDERGERQASFRLIPGRKNDICVNYFQTMIGENTDVSVEIHPTKHSDSVEFETPCGVLTKTDIETRFRAKTVNGKDNESEEVDFWNRVDDSINMLRLEKLYNTHEQEIAALLKNRYRYNKSGVDMILGIFLEKEIFSQNEHEVDSLVRNTLYFGSLDQELWGDRPLNKLKHDILEQIDEIETFDTNDGGEFSDRQRNT